MNMCLRFFYIVLSFIVYLSSSFVEASETLDFGTAGVRALSIEKERDLGTYFMTIARSKLPIIYDPVLEKYLSNLVSRLATNAQGVHYPFESFLVEDETINAAAFFGGKIMVHTGLFLVTKTESELASVLAHEMTHITQRHLARNMESMQDVQNLGLVGVLGGIILSIINPALGMATVSASISGVNQSSINYTRTHEYEADRLGIELLYDSYFDPNGMASMMRNLVKLGDKINPSFEMLMTHPLTEKRIAEAENRIRFFKERRYYESIDFQFAKARVEVRFSKISAKYNLSEANNRLKHNSKDYGALYKKVLALIELKYFKDAAQFLDILEEDFPRNLFVIDTKSDILIGLKKYDEAIEYLSNLRQVLENNQVVLMNLAVAYISKKQYASAERILRRVIRDEISVPANELLLDVYKKEKDVCKMYQVNTQIFEYKGQWDLALNNAKQAEKKCTEKNTILKMRAQMGRIVLEKDFYEKLIGDM